MRVAQVLEPRLGADAAGRVVTAEVGGTRSTDAYQLYLAATRHALLLCGDGLRNVPGTALATVHAALREAEPALDALERAYRDRDARLVFLKDDPLLADLRGEPRFIALIRKLGIDRFGRGLSPV